MKKIVLLLLFIQSLSLLAQNNTDTLFVKYDEKLLIRNQNPENKKFYYSIRDSKVESGSLLFIEKKIHKEKKTIQSNKMECLKELIKKAEAFAENDSNDIIDDMLLTYFNNKKYRKYYFVKKNKFIEVAIEYIID